MPVDSAATDRRDSASSRVRRAQELERHRWARELHDDTLQAIATMALRCAALARREPDPVLRAALEDIGAEARRQAAALRRLIEGLRPPELELGLEPAIAALAERAATSGLDVRWDVRASDIDPDAEVAVFRLVQEALSNAVRHAHAAHAAVDVRPVPGGVRIVITDDGRGFDPGAPSRGCGLAGMRERAALAGGRLAVRSGSAGTRIVAVLAAAPPAGRHVDAA